MKRWCKTIFTKISNNALFLTFSLLVPPISLCETHSATIENLYDKIYVISLDRTPKRYAHVKKQLDRFNLKHEKFSAVDGKLITVTDAEKILQFLGRRHIAEGIAMELYSK